MFDWPMIDRLATINPDFRDFLTNISNTAKIQVVSGVFDPVLEGEQYDAYLRKKGMEG